ncbi:MAG: hypothetical protein KKE05_04395, partial [Nanoarchaeota archaeon]|nr:hypothetical protein [Nanoarchaeota archaeon]
MKRFIVILGCLMLLGCQGELETITIQAPVFDVTLDNGDKYVFEPFVSASSFQVAYDGLYRTLPPWTIRIVIKAGFGQVT